MRFNTRLNKINALIGVLFIVVAVLLSAIGLNFFKDGEPAWIWPVLAVCGGVNILALSVGLIYLGILSRLSAKPGTIREKFLGEFNNAEKNIDGYLKKLTVKNFFIWLYFGVLSLAGTVFFVTLSLTLFIEAENLFLFPVALVVLCPVWRAIELYLKRDGRDLFNCEIKRDEFSDTFELFESEINSFFRKKLSLIISFGTTDGLELKIDGRKAELSINTYAFKLFTQNELKAILLREMLCISDKRYGRAKSICKSRGLFTQNEPIGILFAGYFSFVIDDTANTFEFGKNAVLRYLESRADELISKTEYAEDYLRAYKKLNVFESYLSDSRSYISLNLYGNEENEREFARFVFSHFQKLMPTYGEEWEKSVEDRLKALVCSKLVYSEKASIIGKNVKCGEIVDNCTEEMKCIYDKYDKWYYDNSKPMHKAKREGVADFYREIDRYEQNPEDYGERLKLISIAHAYYTVGKIEKAEEIYAKILEEDLTPETCFDYGCFLLLAKKDTRGIEYIYKSMENENMVDDGLEVLGRHFINAGDKEGYERFCEYKKQRLEEIVNSIKDKSVNPNSRLYKTSLDQQTLDLIAGSISKDDNIKEIYCADLKSRNGKRVAVFGVALRNKSEQAYYESFERIFSILDNDFGKYDTLLISIDHEPRKQFIKRIKKGEKFLIYKR